MDLVSLKKQLSNLPLLPRKPSGAQSDDSAERKQQLITFLQNARAQLVRLLVIVKWAKTNASFVTDSFLKLSQIEKIGEYFRNCADSLYFVHENLDRSNCRAPIYDIPTAIDVLTTGTYQRLPESISEIVSLKPMPPSEISNLLLRLNEIINLRILRDKIPNYFHQYQVLNGRLSLKVNGEFTAALTLTGESTDDKWRLLNFEILIKTDPSSGIEAPIFPNLQLTRLHELVQRNIEGSPEPFQTLYKILHTFCQSWKLCLLSLQGQLLSKTSHVFGDLAVEYQQDQRLKLVVWKNFKIEIEINQRNDLVVLGYKPDEINIDSENLNLEKILMKALKIHIEKKILCLVENLLEEPSENFTTKVVHHQDQSEVVIQFNENKMFVTVDFSTGKFKLFEPEMHLKHQKRKNLQQTLQKLQEDLNQDQQKFHSIIKEWCLMKQFEAYEWSGAELGLSCIRLNNEQTSPVLYFSLPAPYNRFYFSLKISDDFIPKFHLIYSKHDVQRTASPISPLESLTEQVLKQRKVEGPAERLHGLMNATLEKLSRLLFSQQRNLLVLQLHHVEKNHMRLELDFQRFGKQMCNVDFNSSCWRVCLNDTMETIVASHKSSNVEIHYSNKQWQFLYHSAPSESCLARFYKQLSSVLSIRELFLQFQSLPSHSHLLQHFQLVSYSAVSISFSFHNKLLKIGCPGDTFLLAISHPLQDMITESLKRMNPQHLLLQLFDLLLSTTEACELVQLCIEQVSSTFGLKNELVMTPRSETSIKILFREHPGIIMSFPSPGMIFIENNSLPELHTFLSSVLKDLHPLQGSFLKPGLVTIDVLDRVLVRVFHYLISHSLLASIRSFCEHKHKIEVKKGIHILYIGSDIFTLAMEAEFLHLDKLESDVQIQKLGRLAFKPPFHDSAVQSLLETLSLPVGFRSELTQLILQLPIFPGILANPPSVRISLLTRTHNFVVEYDFGKKTLTTKNAPNSPISHVKDLSGLFLAFQKICQ